MHMLHKILVRIHNGPANPGGRVISETIEHARHLAESATEDYTQAFDWRETMTAGRWSDIYPTNVILSADGINRFIDEITECRELQMGEIRSSEHRIKELLGSLDLQALIDRNVKDVCDFSALYNLRNLADLLSGTYIFESGFFDTDTWTAKISDKTIAKIKESPKDWALVMFDYHI